MCGSEAVGARCRGAATASMGRRRGQVGRRRTTPALRRPWRTPRRRWRRGPRQVFARASALGEAGPEPAAGRWRRAARRCPGPYGRRPVAPVAGSPILGPVHSSIAEADALERRGTAAARRAADRPPAQRERRHAERGQDAMGQVGDVELVAVGLSPCPGKVRGDDVEPVGQPLGAGAPSVRAEVPSDGPSTSRGPVPPRSCRARSGWSRSVLEEGVGTGPVSSTSRSVGRGSPHHGARVRPGRERRDAARRAGRRRWLAWHAPAGVHVSRVSMWWAARRGPR